MTAAIACHWDGRAFVPLRQSAGQCTERFGAGEIVLLDVQEERSALSHRHYFAAIREAWANLPELYDGRWPSPEHLRKWALIQSGYSDERSIVCASKAEARRMAAFIQPCDEYSIVLALGSVVRVFTARSQSLRAMGKAEFQASKDHVLETISKLIGTTAGELEQHARAA